MAVRGNYSSVRDRQWVRYVPCLAQLTPRHLHMYRVLCNLVGRKFKFGTELPVLDFSNARRRVVAVGWRFFRDRSAWLAGLSLAYQRAVALSGHLRKT